MRNMNNKERKKEKELIRNKSEHKTKKVFRSERNKTMWRMMSDKARIDENLRQWDNGRVKRIIWIHF